MGYRSQLAISFPIGLVHQRLLLATQALRIVPVSVRSAKPFDCASLEACANKSNIYAKNSNKISVNTQPRGFLSIFFDCLPSFPPKVRVEGMKTSHTLIQLRQHRSLCLVSARLPG
jgi:hypothetical protein